MTKRTCEYVGCPNPHKAYGLCEKHWRRVPKEYRPRKLTDTERFWSRVDKAGPIPSHVPDLGACWVWKGRALPTGYGQCFFNGQEAYPHRVSWELATGVAPGDLFVLHRCDNPPCVRPSHLFLGTQADNIRDMMAKGRGSPRRTHCKWGHPLEGGNIYLDPRGHRYCRKCGALRRAECHRRQKTPDREIDPEYIATFGGHL